MPAPEWSEKNVKQLHSYLTAIQIMVLTRMAKGHASVAIAKALFMPLEHVERLKIDICYNIGSDAVEIYRRYGRLFKFLETDGPPKKGPAKFKKSWKRRSLKAAKVQPVEQAPLQA